MRAMCALVLISLLGGLACEVNGARAGSEQSLLYVSNEAGNSISVIDASRDEVVRTIDVGKRPRGLKVSPDRKLLYVALSGSARGGPNVDESLLPPPERAADGIGMVDRASGKYLGKIAAGSDPECFDITADGKLLVIANEDAARATLVDVSTKRVLGEVAVGVEPEGVSLTPDGKQAFVASEAQNQIDVIDVATRSVVASIPTSARPRSVVFTGNGKRAFVAAENGSAVDVLDAKALRRTTSIVISGDPPSRPMGLALDERRQRLYVSTGRGRRIAVLNTERLTFERAVEGVGERPWGIALNHDGTKLYTANGPSNDVSVIDTETLREVKRIRVGALPWGLAFARP